MLQDFCRNSFVFTQKNSVIDMAKVQINSETILFLKIFLFGKPVSLLLTELSQGIINTFSIDYHLWQATKSSAATLA